MMSFLLIWSLSSLGFVSLAASMSKHQKQIFAQELDASKGHLAQICGWILLAISLVLSVSPSTLSNGISYWMSVLTFSALAVGLCLSYYSHKMKLFTLILGFIVILSGLFHLI